MSEVTYSVWVAPAEKPSAWLAGEVKTPPLSKEARKEAGFLLRQLQRGEVLSMPQSRPMPSIGPQCCELRIKDADREWRILYRIDPDAILVLDVFQKQSRRTPQRLIDNCRRRLKNYDSDQ